MTFEKILDNLTFDRISGKHAREELLDKAKQKTIRYYINRNVIKSDPLSEHELSQLNTIVGILQILYNAGIDTTVSDSNYDTLQEMLVDMGIPRLTGSKEINSNTKVSHKYTTLRGTLSKVYYLFPDEKRTNKSRKYLDEWIKTMESKYQKVTGKSINLNDCKVLVQNKFDGCSCILENDNNKMVWITRGDTENNQASDASHIMNIFNDVYKDDINCGIKFEVMMTEDNKEHINELMRDNPYKNSRQIVSAIINSSEADFKAEYLYPVPLRIIHDGDDIESIHPKLIETFPTLITTLGDRDGIKKFSINNKIVKTKFGRFRTDGAVITILDPKIQSILGRDNNINNFEVAYKFTEETTYSKIKDIEFYVSDFGFITPVLVINPVVLKGNTITRISISNKERFDELDLSYGDEIKVLYDIIPYATLDANCHRAKHSRKIEFVNTCPKCHEPIDLNVVQVQCHNKDCPSRLIGRVLNYCSTLRIQNIGYQTLDTLYSAGLLKHGIRSLYKLKKKKYEVEDLPGFGQLKAKKIISEIEKTRRLKDYVFFGAIGIESLGTRFFKVIFENIAFEQFMKVLVSKDINSLYEPLLKISGIGEKKASILIDYLKNTNNRNELMKLLEEVWVDSTFRAGDSAINKGRIVFSGIRPDSYVSDKLIMAGWEVTDSWNNSAKYLVAPNASFTSSKVSKAISLGVPIIYANGNILENLEKGIPNLYD